MYATPDILTLILPNEMIYHENNVFKNATMGLSGQLE